jgi:hypothetical protein
MWAAGLVHARGQALRTVQQPDRRARVSAEMAAPLAGHSATSDVTDRIGAIPVDRGLPDALEEPSLASAGVGKAALLAAAFARPCGSCPARNACDQLADMDLRKIGRIAAKILLDKMRNGDGTHDIRPASPDQIHHSEFMRRVPSAAIGAAVADRSS